MAGAAKRVLDASVSYYEDADESDSDDVRPVKKPVKSKSKKGRVVDSDSEFEVDKDAVEDDDDEDIDDVASMEMEIEREDEGETSEQEDEEVLSFDEDLKPAKGKGKGKRVSKVAGDKVPTMKQLDENLKPISALLPIFKDITSKATKELSAVVKRLSGRSLKVGTMCSGTESPLLALDKITTALQELTGETLKVEHVFSCEIEPFKQAYIERNFSPPLLFRDVTELGGDEAQTAYGGRRTVPGGLDLLVAGTSCVDYSNLNGKQKNINAGGESGATFFGMLDYVNKHRTPIVILENVQKAPWDQCIHFFERIGYAAQDISLDTKRYYIPHTRTRGYMIAVLKEHKAAASKWVDVLRSLARPASVPLEKFLFPTDEPPITRARLDLSTARQTRDGIERAKADWNKCESRHARARDEELLGEKRPLTAWQENGGPPSVMDGAWGDWAAAQTERVLDLMDINALRLAKKNVDVNFKTAVWNLSQNVDRSTTSPTLGVSPCLTPNMIPYLTNRGGPVIGLEALSLQGLPIEQLILTRESTDQLADLAGNAMTSTVVGAAIVAALCVAGLTLPAGAEVQDVEMEDTKEQVEHRIRGDDKLEVHQTDFASSKPVSETMLQRAGKSARKCICEGRSSTSSSKIFKCNSCGYSACAICRSRPEHDYTVDPDNGDRLAPHTFEAEFKEGLPMIFGLTGFDIASLEKQAEVRRESNVPIDEDIIHAYIKRVALAIDGAKFHFRAVTRREHWIATFASDLATLTLHLDPKGLNWQLVVSADEHLAVNDPVRQALNSPVARMFISTATNTYTEGKFDIRLPIEAQTLGIELEPIGEPVPSWRSELGLVDYKDEKRPFNLKVTVSKEGAVFLDRPIDGLYQLETKCGTACNSLHRRVEPNEATPLYLFFDPTRSGESERDCWVFAPECGPIDYGNARPILGSLPPGWFLHWDDGAKQSTTLAVSSVWSKLENASIAVEPHDAGSTIAMPSKALHLAADDQACSFAESVLSARIRLTAANTPKNWASKDWHQVDLLHEGAEVLGKLAWVFARLPEWSALKSWQNLDASSLRGACETCCPPRPEIQWMRSKNTIVAIENGTEAARFEQALKKRPTPILLHTRQEGIFFEFRIGLNVATLAHKALGKLPVHRFRNLQTDPACVQWRLSSADSVDLTFGRPGVPRVFKLSSNRKDVEASQPPHFLKYGLRPEQLRSLTWMIAQENNPTPWVEEEVTEAALPQLGWHVEARATRQAHVRGGVLADEVGYGKTAITIGLMCAQQAAAALPTDADRIPTKATLIIVPPQLSAQWPSEIAKFTDGKLVVLTIKTINDLKALTIRDIQKADVIIVSISVLRSPLYWSHFGDFSASSRSVAFDTNAGRYFRSCVDDALEGLPAQLNRLRDPEQGAAVVFEAIQTARKNRKTKDEIPLEPPRRLKGQAFAFQQAMIKAGRKDVLSLEAAEAAINGDSKDGAHKAKRVAKAKPTPAAEVDPWKLQDKDVKKNFKAMHAPPLAIFAFARVVIDEFTYVDDAQLSAIRSIRASSRWILSGTPATKSFMQIKTIAELLNVHLGVDDEFKEAKFAKGEKAGRGQAKSVRAENTKAEEFHSFRDVHTIGWHRRRDEIAQKFLDQYARQNVAEIDEIPFEEQLVKVDLPAAEMAIYRELEHFLLALDVNFTKVAKVKAEKANDRQLRLSEALGVSDSPEEALLKRCSHFSTDMDAEADGSKDAPDVCDWILGRRQYQCELCEAELREVILECAKMQRDLEAGNYFFESFNRHKKADVQPFLSWLRDVYENPKAIGDEDAHKAIMKLCMDANCKAGTVGVLPPGGDVKFPDKWHEVPALNKNADKSTQKAEEHRRAKVWVLREHVHLLRRLHKELVGRFRSMRYFEMVRKIQRGSVEEAQGIAILSSCGHSGPTAMVKEKAKAQECIDLRCRATVRDTNVVEADTLGHEGASGTFGVKLEQLVNIVDTLPKDDRVLVFVQFDDLFAKVYEALASYGLTPLTLAGTAAQSSSTLTRFQEGNTKERILLLHLTNSSASGANLMIANWAFFVSPLLTDTLEKYRAYETQAIGRIRRYGQQKKVKIFRLLTHGTIDIKIFEERTGLNVAKRLEEQEIAKPGSNVFPKTSRLLKRVSYARGPSAPGGKKASAIKKGKAKAESEDDASLDDSDTEDPVGPPPKRAPAPSRKSKSIKKIVILDSESDDAAQTAQKAKRPKVQSSDESDTAPPPKTAPTKAKINDVPAGKKRKSSSCSATAPLAGRVIAGVSNTKLAPLFAKVEARKTVSSATLQSRSSTAISTSSKRHAEAAIQSPPKKKMVVSVVVTPLSPSKRAALQVAEDRAAISASSRASATANDCGASSSSISVCEGTPITMEQEATIGLGELDMGETSDDWSAL